VHVSEDRGHYDTENDAAASESGVTTVRYLLVQTS
jgi:hypothetical protein